MAPMELEALLGGNPSSQHTELRQPVNEACGRAPQQLFAVAKRVPQRHNERRHVRYHRVKVVDQVGFLVGPPPVSGTRRAGRGGVGERWITVSPLPPRVARCARPVILNPYKCNPAQ
eukprot:scaffold13139_cov121-Isochrysis_galbana.AAC.3